MSTLRDRMLIVDDEPYIREFLGEILSAEFQVAFAQNGKNALEVIKRSRPSLIILDLVMPEMGGIKLLEILKKDAKLSQIPVVILSGLNDTQTRIEAFSIGIDDYIQKPFHPEELLLRVKSKLNKRSPDVSKPTISSNQNNLQFGNLSFIKASRTIKIKNKDVALLELEASILEYLLSHHGQICSREDIADAIWHTSENSNPRNLDPHISALRKKIKGSDQIIKTIYGSGYTIKDK